MPTKSKVGILTLAIAIFAITVTYAYTVDVKYDREIGRYLVDENEHTLYYFEGDTAATCNFDGSRDDWPSFYAQEIDIPEELDRSDFREIVGREGDPQTTYKNWPLYLCSMDKASGDVEGDRKGGMRVMTPTKSPA